jgi:hypothetical protein
MTANNPMPPPSQKLVNAATGKMEEPWYRYFNTERLATDDGAVSVSNNFVVSVVDYGATGDGATNDTDAIVAAIDAVGAAGGGTVYFPAGTYMVDPDSLIIGNGTNAAVSTITNVALLGAGSSPYFLTGAVIKARSAGTFLLEVRGVIQGIRIENLLFNCNSLVQYAWRMYSVHDSFFRNFALVNFTNYGFYGDCRTGPTVNWAARNCFQNFYIASSVVADFGAGILLTGDAGSNRDWHQCLFQCGIIQLNEGAVDATRGIDLKFTDSNTFMEVDSSVTSGSNFYGATFDGTVSSPYPQNNFFYGCSIEGTFVSGTIDRNFFYNFCTKDSEVVPTSTSLLGWTDQGAFFGQAITPYSNDGSALGTASLSWADLYLADGGTLNFGQSASRATLVHTSASDSLTIQADPDNATANSGIYFSVDGTVQAVQGTAAFAPNANDGISLGIGTQRFADLYLADGSQIQMGASGSQALLLHTSASDSLTLSADIDNATANTQINLDVDGASVAAVTSGSIVAYKQIDISNSSAGQIKFPATQNPSTVATVLDDYEEGYWTPALNPGSGAFGGIAYNTAATTGSYTKIGDTVFINGFMTVTTLSTGTGTGTLYISGLPYTPSTHFAAGSWNIGYDANWGRAPNSMLVSPGFNAVNLYVKANSTAASSGLTVNDITTANHILYFSGHYKVST